MPPPQPATPLTLIVATTPIRLSTHTPNTHPVRLGIGLKGTLPWPRIKADMAFFARVTTRAPARGTTNAVIMGRKTYDSVPKSLRPLARRINVVITRDTSGGVREGVLEELKGRRARIAAKGGDGSGQPETETSESEGPVTDAIVSSSLDAALEELHSNYGCSGRLGKIFVIGGAEIYGAALRMGVRDNGSQAQKRPVRIVMTNVLRKTECGEAFECDTFFPEEDLTPSNGWRSVDAREVSEWVGEEVTEEWKEEGGVKFQMVGFERV